MAHNLLADNLERLRGSLRRHCDEQGACGCAARRKANGARAERAATLMPLSWSASTVVFRDVSRDQAIRSQRDLHEGTPPRQAVGGQTVETALGTDNAVFTYAGPVRYPRIEPIALLFQPTIERQHTGLKRATAFDSGGLQEGVIRPRISDTRGSDIVAFLRGHELPVPEYRRYLADILATAFEDPLAYLWDSPGPLCETTLAVEPADPSCDSRRWTFEVRFEGRIDLAWNLSAVFLPRALEKEHWGFEFVLALKKRGVHHAPYVTTDGETAWDAIRSLSRTFIQRNLEASMT